MKKFSFVILIFSFVASCGSVSEGFKLKKSNTGDEFLVEKKNPLVLPPEFSELPEPGNANLSDKNEENSFESKILVEGNSDQQDSAISSASSTEDFILKNIKKNESN